LFIAEELESIVQLFAEVLRDYQIPAEEMKHMRRQLDAADIERCK